MSGQAAGTVQSRAMRLLGLIRDATEESGTPVFAEQFMDVTGWDLTQVRSAFRYLADKGMVDTFSIPFAGRINAQGQDELERQANQSSTPVITMSDTHEWDAFLSHAGEDKADIAAPLAEALQARGIRVWLDALAMTVGDSLSRSIDAGLAKSRFGIVVLSPYFFSKEWPRRELDGLVAREVAGQKVILPVWHRIDKGGVLQFSPTLADRVAAQSSKGIDSVADALMIAIKKGGETLIGREGLLSRVQTEASVADAPSSVHPPNGEEIHRRRVAEIIAGKTPTKLMNHGLLILHVIPGEALSGRSNARFEVASGQPRSFLPMGSTSLQEFRITADGLLVGSNGRGIQEEQRAYSFIFRSGLVESVASSILRGHEKGVLPLPAMQTVITDQTLRLAKALNNLGFVMPYHVHVTLAGVGGVRLLQQWPDGAFAEDMPFGDLGEGALYFDSTSLASVPADRHECYRMLRPVLIHLANAANLQTPPPLI